MHEKLTIVVIFIKAIYRSSDKWKPLIHSNKMLYAPTRGQTDLVVPFSSSINSSPSPKFRQLYSKAPIDVSIQQVYLFKKCSDIFLSFKNSFIFAFFYYSIILQCNHQQFQYQKLLFGNFTHVLKTFPSSISKNVCLSYPYCASKHSHNIFPKFIFNRK